MPAGNWLRRATAAPADYCLRSHSAETLREVALALCCASRVGSREHVCRGATSASPESPVTAAGRDPGCERPSPAADVGRGQDAAGVGAEAFGPARDGARNGAVYPAFEVLLGAGTDFLG